MAILEDTTKPVLHSLSVTPEWSDDPSGVRQIVIEGEFSDDISGLKIAHGSPVIEWWSPSGQRYGTQLHTLKSGDEYNGIYTGSFELSRYAESGIWKLVRLEYQDKAGNGISDNWQTLMQSGISTDYEIHNPLSDNSAPQILSINLFPKWSTNPSESKILEIQAHFTDDLSGLKIAHGSPVIEWWSPSGRCYGTHLDRLLSGNNTDGIYIGTIALPEDADKGVWTLGRLEFSDEARNSASHSRLSLLNLGINTDFSVNQSITTSATDGSSISTKKTTDLQSTTVSNNQIRFTFSDVIKIAGSKSLSTNLLTVTVDGQTRRISSAQIDPTNPNQLLITLTGSSLQSASSISVAYNAPATGVTTGFLTDSIGTKLDTITNQVVNTYTATSNVSKSGIGNAYQNLILTSSATTGYGNAQNNTLTGNDGNNTLNGLEGADTMIGGKGDDTYVVENIADIVTEKTNEGTDTVQSSINYTLGANVENLTLTGSDNLNGTGNELNNIITGNSGNNRLDGGTGADKLIGGRGDDTYVVDNAGDVVVESTSQGADTVLASVNFTLSDNVENLTLTGTDSITGTGNSLKNTIIGNSGNNLIDGKGDADTLTGLGGGDTFQFSIKPITFRSSTADHITDFSSSQGDKIQIVKSAFGINNSTASLSVVSGSTQVASALATASLFVYDSSSGELYWNQNGITKGAGSGGIFAVLDNKASLFANNFALV